jgi:tetratricopeptide (TPR) repeat protein
VTKAVTVGTSAVTDARGAAAHGDWQRAYDLLLEADAIRALAIPDLALFADVAYAAGHLDVTIDTWERAYAESLRAGDRAAAAGAATRVALHLLVDTGLIAPVRSWIKRADQLLENQDETPAHAWLAVVRNYERLLSGNFVEARRWARRATEVGLKCDPGAAAIGRIAEARSFILEGEVSRGLELLDEAAVAIVSGELDQFATGLVYCELVCALQAVSQYDLAEEWTQAMERWRHGHGVGSIHGRCRVHRAEVLRLRGSTGDAEKEALLACEELRPYLRREFGWPLTELGRIRLRKGDIEGADQAFFEAHQVGWDPQPGIALVHLARGEVALAAASIRDALDHPTTVPSKELPPNTELRRAPLLDAQVEIAIAAGDLARARWAADELEKIAATFQSKAFNASAAAARGNVRLAEGNTADARSDFEVAVRLWSEVGAPHEAALARMGLGRVYQLEANEDSALREFRAARSVFERIGSVKHAEGAALASRDVVPEGRVDVESILQPQVNIFHREGEYWSVTFGAHTTRVRDVKGIRYLARLLADPGREVHVLDLVSLEGGRAADIGDSGPMLDGRAKEAYRRRLAEIEEDIEEARTLGDTEREKQADAERDFLVRELSRAFGLGGRDRTAGSPSERARASVTRAVRSAMLRIDEHDPQLGDHLDRTIRTGTYCVYLPDPRVPVAWRI